MQIVQMSSSNLGRDSRVRACDECIRARHEMQNQSRFLLIICSAMKSKVKQEHTHITHITAVWKALVLLKKARRMMFQCY